MRLNLVDSASKEIPADIRSRYPSTIATSDAVQNYLADRVREWASETGSVLHSAFPLASHERKLLDWQARLQAPPDPESDPGAAVADYSAFCKLIGHPPNEIFWKKQFQAQARTTAIGQKFADDTTISTRLLLTGWQKLMDQARAAWELKEIALRREALMERLEELFRLLHELDERLRSLGLDTGILLDLSRGNLTPQDIRQFERWAKYFAEDEGIKALCDLLGRIRQIELSERIERVRSNGPIHATMPDISSREEIVGIRLGRDIEHALPSELALLADPDTALLFDLKVVESSLMCFDMQGIQSVVVHGETEEDRSVKEADKQGPMVICIDTSGSMSGMPETVAKAVALSLATKAREEQRPCYLINFSTGIDTLDLSEHVGMESVLRFLQMSFHGGTDVTPALEHALDKMEEDEYRNADVLIVSDFIMAELPERSLERIKIRRLDGNKFHSLVIGTCYMTERLKTFFDNEWIYEPSRGHIHELLGFQRKLNDK
jgi:uncharacterized protein with von Willebrand factor type A (vWA) domain